MTNWYVSSVGWTAVTAFAISHAYNIGDLIRQLAAPTVNNERVFRCTSAGTSAGSEPAWTLTKGATTTSGGATFTEVTGNETYQGVSWAAPHARLHPVVQSAAWAVAGDTVFISNDHAETTSAAINTANAPQTINTPFRLLCVARPSTAIPPVPADLTTGASISTTGANAITFSGVAYVYGVRWNCASGAAGAQALTLGGCLRLIADNCTFNLGSTSGTSFIDTASAGSGTGQYFFWKNCTVVFGSSSDYLRIQTAPFLWDGGALQGTPPTNLLGVTNVITGPVDIRNVDLSIMGASTFLVNAATSHLSFSTSGITFANCKLNASLGGVVTGVQTSHEDSKIDLVVSDSLTNTSREEHYRFAGSIVADTANYLSASDGTTSKSWKFATNANCSYLSPLEGPDIIVWVSTTGGHTFTMYTSNITNVNLQTHEFGFDIEYMGSSLTPLGTVDSSLANILTTGVDCTNNGVTWAGQTPTNKQQTSKLVTINRPGFVRIKPLLCKPSVTVWIDPLVYVS